jgi:hypothetical protein
MGTLIVPALPLVYRPMCQNSSTHLLGSVLLAIRQPLKQYSRAIAVLAIELYPVTPHVPSPGSSKQNPTRLCPFLPPLSSLGPSSSCISRGKWFSYRRPPRAWLAGAAPPTRTSLRPAPPLPASLLPWLACLASPLWSRPQAAGPREGRALAGGYVARY